MAEISSYPLKTPKSGDLITFSETYDANAANPVIGNPTKSATVGSINALAVNGTVGTIPVFTGSNIIGDSQLVQLGPNTDGVYQIRFNNADRLIVNKPSSVTNGDPEFLIMQDSVAKVSMGWDDDGDGYGFLYNWAGNGWRFGSAGNNPELTIVTAAGQEGVTIANSLTVNSNIDTLGDYGYLINGYGWANEASGVLTLGDWDGSDFVTRIMDQNGTEVLRVTDGNVGIGTTSPDYKLDVEGDISLVSGGENYAIMSPISQGMQIAVGDPAEIATPLATFDGANQRVGIGTDSPQRELDVNGGVRVRGPLDLFQQNDNTFAGTNAGNFYNVVGNSNAAFGEDALAAITSASRNTAVGFESLKENLSGNNNTAIGTSSMALSTAGSFNTALGNSSLSAATTGQGNTAIGNAALTSKTTSNFNTAIGHNSLSNITTGFKNTAVGNDAGRFTSDGTTANSTGRNSIFIGDSAKASADNQTNEIVIGVGAVGNGSNTTTIGSASTISTEIKGNVSVSNTGTSATLSLKSSSTGFGGNYIHAKKSDNSNQWVLGSNSAFNDQVILKQYNEADIIFANNSGYAVTIVPNGNVGIGTTSPSAKLNVYGGIKIEGTSSLSFGGSGSIPAWGINSNGNDLIINDVASVQGAVLFQNVKGIVPRNATTAEISAITGANTGAMVYNTTLNTICFYNGSAWRQVSHTAM